MRKLLPLLLLCLIVTISPLGWAGFYGPGNFGDGFYGASGAPSLARTPSDYGTVLRWYKPDGTSGTQSGTNFDVTSGQVTKWWDSSANAWHPAQGTTTYGPLYVSNCINGYSCIDVGSGSGSNRRYLTKDTDDAIQNRAAVSTYMMRNIADSGIYIELLKWSENGSTSNMRVQMQTADGTRRLLKKGERLDADTLTQTLSGSSAYAQNTWEADQILDDFTNGNHKWYTGSGLASAITNPISANYTSGGGGNSENSTSARFTIGNDGFYTAVSTAYIAEVVQFPALHVWGQRMGMYNYLMHKYRPSVAPTLSGVTSILGRWEFRNDPRYQTNDTTGSTSISTLLDQTTNGNNWQQTTKANQPTPSSNRIGGEFVAASSHTLPLISGKLGIIKNQSVVCATTVFNPNTTHTGYLVWFSDGGTATNFRFALRTTSGGKVELYQRRVDGAGGGYSLASSNSYDTGHNNIATGCVDYATNDADVYLNGVNTDGAAASTGAFSNTNSLNASIGSSNGTNFFDGRIRGVILYTSVSDITAIENYLNWEFI